MKKHKQKRDLHREITQRFIDALNEGCAPWIRPWEDTGSNVPGEFPVNAATGRRYQGINITLLWQSSAESGYASNRWLTYRQASMAGGHVRRNEKGTRVVFYRTIEKRKNATDPPDSPPETFRVMRAFTLFNVEQCEELPDSVLGEAVACAMPRSGFPDVDALVERCGVPIRHGGNSASYDRKTDAILMPPANSFKSAEHYYCTLLHELCHWTGRQDRLDRPGITARIAIASAGCAYEELIAEIGSAFLCAEFGIRGDLRHEAYVESWIDLMEDKPRAIFQAAAEAQTAADYLISLNGPAAV